MATAHPKFTGEVGVCVTTSSRGAFHMLNGLYDAASDNQPVVDIVGPQGLASLGTFNQQENNLERTFADVALLCADHRHAAAGAGRDRHGLPHCKDATAAGSDRVAARRAGHDQGGVSSSAYSVRRRAGRSARSATRC